MVTLSTAESEMTEVIEAMTAGESVAVIVQELYPVVTKTAFTDSQAAESILSCDGGSWRTRHLRLRSAFARQAILQGFWALQHVPGDQMLADLGTKALNAPRLEKLKELMSMGSMKNEDEKVKEKEKVEEKKEEKFEENEGKENMKWAEAAQAVRLITLAAAISTAKAVEEEEKKDEGKINFERVVLFYTIFVVLATLLAKRIWKVGVHLVGIIAQRRAEPQGGSLPGEAAREEKKEGKRGKTMEEDAGTSHGVHAAASSSTSSTPMSSQAAPLPKVTPAKKGAPRPLRVPKAKSVATGDHQSSAIPTPRVQHPKASPPTQMPNIEEDIFGSWDEIEREERRVRIELNAAKPGDPILGPIELLPDAEFPELPFRVFTTKFGEVYHLDRNCRHLTSINTGISKESRWCSRCRRSSYQAGSRPVMGAVLYLKGFGREAHTDMRCPAALGAGHYPVCTACGEQPTQSSLS